MFSLFNEPAPLVLLALATVLFLGVEAWRRAAARAETHRTEAARAEAELETLRDQNWELAEREERYRDLVKTQGDIILRKDLMGRVTYVNDVFCATFGKEATQILGLPFAPDLPEGETPRMLGSFSGLAVPPYRVRFDQRVLTVAGPRWFAWEEFAVRDDEGRLKEIQTVGRDITDHKAVEEKLTGTLDEAQAANRAKGLFLAAMSHEIRTPMNGVLGMTNLLLDTKLTPAQRSYAEAVKHSGEALLSIINDILDYSKIEAGKIDIAEGPLDLRGTLESVCELLSPKAFERGLEIIAEVEPQVPLRLSGDETRIRQVLINLAGNAVKFTEKGGVILRARLDSYSYTDDKANIVIEVEDTGIGIEADALEVIFDEFAQADQTLARRFEGTGLGLAISRHLVTAMNGTIEVESTVGRGSLFRVSLPLAAVEPAMPRRASLNGQRIIILEDRPILAASLARSARLAGADVRLVPTGEALIAALEQEPADVLMCPIDTAEGPGAALVARARAFAPGIDALVLLRPQDRDRLPALIGQEGNPAMFQRIFDGYLVRPVRASSLLARLEALTGDGATPRAEQSRASEQTEKKRPEAWSARLNVLVAEDNEINALLTRTLLERDGHTVRIARNGQEVLDALDEADTPADLVLMDLHMPGMDGFEATRRIRALSDDRSSIPVIALTANAMADDRQTCLTAGMDDYLSKPVAPDALARMLAEWSNRRSDLGLAPADAARANLA
ncbi:MAG: response regulator [Parvibaculum sp.]|uniref:PAS domain-containing hybrid sensor histidine kinase/response regulator n=1 Tax=Parvibaculum sp. TaxID=2024848 RepID=UPI0025D836F6|nr:response regulator [Parvibaculum sp.]MCE9648144.1 response regulator [Parvibaculum sp.]